jgi:hypothetical protein
MDRVSTRVHLYRMSLFPGVEQATTNIPANILLLEERQPMSLGDSNCSSSCMEWQALHGSSGSQLTALVC